MKLKKPKFWDYKKPNIYAKLLYPFSKILEIFNYKKIYLKKKFPEIFTICVGNIYIGGTGKTSISIEIKKILDDLNIKSCFIKKEYYSQKDEQKLLSNYGKVYTNKNRVESITQAIQDGYPVAIFDDGLQDYSINYDISIVCFNKKNGIGNGYTLPAGPLRQNLKTLKNYQYVFFTGNNENFNELENKIKLYNQNIKSYESKYLPLNINKLNLDKKYIVFSGIGNHGTFIDMLKNYNFKIIKEIEYPDHHNYTNHDLNKLEILSKKNNAILLTTEKDFLRLNENYQKNVKFIKVELKINKIDEIKNILISGYEKS